MLDDHWYLVRARRPGGGGGKPNFAQAGAKDIDKLNDALEYARKDLRTKLLSYSDR